MELVVRKNELLRELQLFQGIVERKNTIPILANVLIEAKGDEVRMLATDLEVALRSQCHASVAKGGSLTLPAKKLYEIVKSLPETDVHIEEDKNGVKVAADRFDSRMQTLPREDFPTLPDARGKTRATLPRDALKQMVEKTQFAITGEDTRYFLNGAKFVLRPDTLTLVATDGHRLALVEVAHKVGINRGDRGNSPQEDTAGARKTARRGRWRRSLRSGGESPLLRRRRSHVDFADDRRTVPCLRARHSRRTTTRTIDFENERLTSAVKRVALLSNERSRAVKFEISKGKVEVTSSSSEFGEASEEIAVDYSGAPLAISFNAQYVLDFLSAVETDSVQLSLKDDVSQAVMRPIGAQGYSYTYVIMPMRI